MVRGRDIRYGRLKSVGGGTPMGVAEVSGVGPMVRVMTLV